MLKAAKHRGFSLVEMLVGISISLVIAFAALTLFTNTMTTSEQVLEKGKLERDLYMTMAIIVADVQRAGYWTNATTSSTNPFMASDVDITTNASNNCVTFSYDKNVDGTVQDNEKFGFRLNDNTLQFRPAGSEFNCTASTTNWINITDPSVIKITAFTVTKSNVAIDLNPPHTINYRTINMTLSAQLANDATVTKTISRSIKVYNNKYVP